jgi:cystathionine gamma-synthase
MVRREDVEPETWAVVGGRPDGAPGTPLNTPLVTASSFILGTDRIYSRNEATETWEAFEALVGGLEGGEAVAFASGMAACAAVLDDLRAGAHLVLGEDCYQGVAGLAAAGAEHRGWHVERLPVADPAWVQRAAEADLLWVESPSNPLLDVADVAAICAAPRKPGTRVVVDNTFATPLGQQPLALGADVSVHSATKFIGGHSDLLLGVAVTRDADALAALRRARGLNGATPGALETFLALRGARTLPAATRPSSACATPDLARSSPSS